MRRKNNISHDAELAPAEELRENSSQLDHSLTAELNDRTILIFEDGKLRPFPVSDYTAATLYQVAEVYSVECKLVRPEEPGTLVYEGKKPSRKTLPAIISRDGTCLLLDSWENLESNPEQLSEAAEVIGVSPVKQVFVLKRK